MFSKEKFQVSGPVKVLETKCTHLQNRDEETFDRFADRATKCRKEPIKIGCIVSRSHFTNIDVFIKADWRPGVVSSYIFFNRGDLRVAQFYLEGGSALEPVEVTIEGRQYIFIIAVTAGGSDDQCTSELEAYTQD